MTSEEFKNIAPHLFDLKKFKSGFIVPKDYFDSVEERVASEIFLNSFERKNSFDIPENYFDLVEQSVFEKISEENNSVPENYFDTIEDRVFDKIKKEPKVIRFDKKSFKKLIPLAIAASILLVFTLQNLNTNTTPNDFTSIDGDDIEFWLDNGDLNFSDNELAFLYEDTEIESVSVFDFYEEEEVFDYLNELDVESLILTN